MFVRAKKIKGRMYAYSVKNTWTEKGPRQKVNAYLGKVVKLESSNSQFNYNPDIEKEPAQVFMGLAKIELMKLGFKENGDLLENESFFFDTGRMSLSEKKGRQKEVVLELNEGFLCNVTLNELMNYKPENDNDGAKLANLLLASGIKVDEGLFVRLFNRLRGVKEPEQAEQKEEKVDFYY